MLEMKEGLPYRSPCSNPLFSLFQSILYPRKNKSFPNIFKGNRNAKTIVCLIEMKNIFEVFTQRETMNKIFDENATEQENLNQ